MIFRNYYNGGVGNIMTIKEYVAFRKEELKKEIQGLDRVPVLSIITVGNDPASEAYVRGKKKDAAEVGIKAIQTIFDENVSQEELLSTIRKQNLDANIDGIIVQLPLPKHISVEMINQAISPKKDVDGFTLGSAFDPCTPKGIIQYLTHEGFSFRGKNAVVLGRSEIVGKPMARMLLERDCNVVQLHSKTSREDKEFYFAHADLIVSAVGRMFSWDIKRMLILLTLASIVEKMDIFMGISFQIYLSNYKLLFLVEWDY